MKLEWGEKISSKICFKTFANLYKESRRIGYTNQGTGYYVWLNHLGLFIDCIITEINDILDFENNYLPFCNDVDRSITGLADYYGKSYHDKGFRIDCPAKTTSQLDIQFEGDVLLWGGDYKIIGTPNEYDYIKIELYVDMIGEKVIVDTISDNRYVKYFPEGSVKRDGSAKLIPKESNMGIRVSYINTGDKATGLGFILEIW